MSAIQLRGDAPVPRIPGLDGLRAVAVTSVLLYHGGAAAVPGGFLGVDLFFVISGFLITRLLLDERTATGRVDVVAFWGRRVRRLLPALAVVVVATLVTAQLVPPFNSSNDLDGDALAAMLYVANWHLMAGGDGYFEQLAAPTPLLHTWSLAIEEQFYLVWPLVLVLALRRALPSLALAAATGGAALSSALLMAALERAGGDTDRLYYGTDTRAQTILVGVTAAFALTHRGSEAAPGPRRRMLLPGWLSGGLALASLAAVLLAMGLVAEDDVRLYHGGLTAYAVVGALLVVTVAASPRGVVTLVLELPPMRYVGALSYGLYLWHWPVFLLMTASRTGLAGHGLLVLRVAVTAALAITSLHLVERPLRRAAWPVPRAAALPVGATAAVLGLVLLVPAALPSAGPEGSAADVAANGRRPAATGTSTPDLESPARAMRRSAPAAPDDHRSGPLRVTVLGDSTARTLAQGLRDVRGRNGVDFHNAAVLGCGVATGSPYRYMGEVDPYRRARCRRWESRWRRVVATRPVDVVAVLIGRWEVADQVVGGAWTHAGRPRFDRYLRQQLEKAVTAATSSGADVAFLTAPYYSRGEQPDGSRWPEDDPARVDAVNGVIRSVVAQHPGTAHVIELGRRTSTGRRDYVNEIDGIRLRYDGVHFTPSAARWLEPWLVRELRRTARGTTAGHR